jgi:hypothetical protein
LGITPPLWCIFSDTPRQRLAQFPPQPQRFIGRVGPMTRAATALALAYSHQDCFPLIAWHPAPNQGHDISTALVDFAFALGRLDRRGPYPRRSCGSHRRGVLDRRRCRSPSPTRDASLKVWRANAPPKAVGDTRQRTRNGALTTPSSQETKRTCHELVYPPRRAATSHLGDRHVSCRFDRTRAT